MCYKCEVCAKLVLPGQPQKKHQIFRTFPQRKVITITEYDAFGEPRKEYHETTIIVRQLEREVKVCAGCAVSLALGTSLQQLVHKHRAQEAATEALPIKTRKRLAPPFPVG